MRKKEESIRIHKYLSEQGVCSRRQAESLIREGLVKVNRKVAELGQKIDPAKDHLSVQGRSIPTKSKIELTLVLNKPRGFICSNRDPHHSQTVFDLLPKEFLKERLYCAGRLDKDSEGLLIITNNGSLTHSITHPSREVIKRYELILNKPFDLKKIPLLKRGLFVDGERLHVDKVVPLKKGPNPECCLEVHLKQGRKREIRRLFEALGYPVKKLYRFQIGGLTLRGIKPGNFRVLNAKDIKKLFV